MRTRFVGGGQDQHTGTENGDDDLKMFHFIFKEKMEKKNRNVTNIGCAVTSLIINFLFSFCLIC